MVDMVLSIQGGDVGASQRAAALMAQQAESPEIIGFAERILALTASIVCREEFGSHYLTAVLSENVSSQPARDWQVVVCGPWWHCRLTRHLKQSR